MCRREGNTLPIQKDTWDVTELFFPHFYKIENKLGNIKNCYETNQPKNYPGHGALGCEFKNVSFT